MTENLINVPEEKVAEMTRLFFFLPVSGTIVKTLFSEISRVRFTNEYALMASGDGFNKRRIPFGVKIV